MQARRGLGQLVPTLSRPDVEVVTEPVTEIGADRIVTADGVERPWT